MIPNTATMAAAARARGLNVTEQDEHEDQHEVTIALPSLVTEVILVANDETGGDVAIVLVWPTWSWESGPDAVTRDVGTLPLSEALSYAAWYAKAEADQYARVEAEIDAAMEAAAPEVQEA